MRTLRDVDGLQLSQVGVQDQLVAAPVLFNHAKVNGTVEHSGDLAAARVRVRRVAGAWAEPAYAALISKHDHMFQGLHSL